MSRHLKPLLLAFVVFGMVFPAAAQTAQEYFNIGTSFYKEGDYVQALDYFTKAITAKANYGDAYRERGFTYNMLNRTEDAMKDLDMALSINRNDLMAHYGKGLVFENQRDYRDALMEYETANDDPAVLIDAYNRIGLILCSEGKYAAAIGYYKRAMDSDTLNNTPCLIINMIEPLLRLRKFEEALTYITVNSTEEKTQSFSAYTNKLGTQDKNAKNASWTFFKQELRPSIESLVHKDYTAAIQTLQQSAAGFVIMKATDPDYQKQSYALLLALTGYAFDLLNKPLEAIKNYEQSLVIQPEQPEVRDALRRLKDAQASLLANDQTGPVITILEPAGTRSISVDDDVVTGTVRHIRGTVTDESGVKSVLLNNARLAVTGSGYFDTAVTLKPGLNAFAIVATDKNANTVVSPVNITINPGKDPADASGKDKLTDEPVYYALLIAENEYKNEQIPDLKKPAADLQLLYNTLVNQYSFEPDKIVTLVNATRVQILSALTQIGERVREGGSLFIFYAGHGDLQRFPDNSEKSYLIPQDAEKGNIFTYINGMEFLDCLTFTKARHILVVADACFAGSLFRGVGNSGNQSLSEKYKDISRRLLSSGNVKVVPDDSQFIPVFLNALQQNKSPFITAEKLVDSFKEQYNQQSNQQLQFLPIDFLKDQGGQFVFKRR